MVYFFLVILGIVGLGALFAPKRTGVVLRYVYFLRVPILFGPLFLLLLAYLGFTSPNAIQNALVTENPIQVLVLAFEAAFLSLLFIYYREQIWIYAQERFDAPPSPFPIPDRKSGKWMSSFSEVMALVIAIPFIAVVIRASEAGSWNAPEGFLEDFVKPLGAGDQGQTLWQGLALVAVIGVAAAHLLAIWIRDVAADDLAKLISRILGWLPGRIRNRLGPGYFTPGDPPQFYQGHAKSILLGLIIFVFYVLSFYVSNPQVRATVTSPVLQWIFQVCEMAITPASYVLGIAMFLMTLLCAITYFLDRYHVPLLAVLLVLTYVASRIQGQSNLFPIVLAQPTEAAFVNAEGLLERKVDGQVIQRPPYAAPVSVTEAYGKRLDLLSRTSPSSEARPDTIVVCASGGGIQAAAWTVQVLTGLDEITEGRFSQHVQLLSATSGGSLGALYYLDTYNLRDGGNTLQGAGVAPRPNYFEQLYRVRRAAADSGLEGILWGFYQIDLPRSLGLSPWLPPLQDRGWVLEMGWREKLNELKAWRQEQTGIPELPGEALTLNGLSHFTARGLIPPVVFNSTIVENGGQTAFATVAFPKRPPKQGFPLGDSVVARFAFHDRYSHQNPGAAYVPDIDRATAVRLSAAFPYITPVAHPFVESAVDASGNQVSPKGLAVPPDHLTDGGFFDNLGILAGMEWIRTIAEKQDLGLRTGRIVILQILDRDSTFGERRPASGPVDNWQVALFGPIQTIFNVRGSTQASRTALELSMLSDLYSGLDIKFISIGPRALNEEHTPPISWKLSQRDLEKLRESWLLHLWENKDLKDVVDRLKPPKAQE